MKFKAIKVKTRESFGSSEANRLRRQGFVPCVLYGGDHKQIHFYGFVNDFRDVVFTPEAFKLELHFQNGETVEAIVQDVQFHPLSDEVTHIDFYEVTDDKIVSTTLPVSFIGSPEGLKQGGRFYRKTRKLKIRGPVKDIPNKLEIDVTYLKMGENLKIRDLEVGELEILNAESVTVASVLPPKGLKKLLGTEEEAVEEVEGEEEGVEGAEGAEGAEGETEGGEAGGEEGEAPKE